MEDWPTRWSDQMQKLDKYKKKGLIRAHGISAHSIGALNTAAEEAWVDVVHARVNAYGNHMDDAPPNVTPAIRKLKDRNVGVIGMKLIGQGDFANDPLKKSNSIYYALNTARVDSMVIGFTKPEQLQDSADTISKTPVTVS